MLSAIDSLIYIFSFNISSVIEASKFFIPFLQKSFCGSDFLKYLLYSRLVKIYKNIFINFFIYRFYKIQLRQ